MRVLIIILGALLTVSLLTIFSKANAELKGEWRKMLNTNTCFQAWERGYKITEHSSIKDAPNTSYLIIKDFNSYYRLGSKMYKKGDWKQSFTCDILIRKLD